MWLIDDETERQVFDRVKNLICLLEDGCIVYINAPGTRIIGPGKPESFVGRRFADHVTPLYQDVIGSFLDGEFDGSEDLPIKLITLSGKAVDAKIRHLPLPDDPDGKQRCLVIGHDVSEMIRYGDELLKSERRYRDLVGASMQLKAVCFWPRIEFINAAGAELLGVEDPEGLCGTDITTFLPPDYQALFADDIDALLEESDIIPVKLIRPDGEERDVQMSFSRVNYSNPPEILVEGRDITAHNKAVAALKHMIDHLETLVDERTEELRLEISERRKAEQLVRYQANYDALTDLPNRNLFFQNLPDTVQAMSERGEKMALMFIDLDGFKDVNDLLGHDAGDLLLKDTAGRLTASVRPRDVVARLGGDEFTVILPEIQEPEDAALIARRVLDVLRRPYELAGREAYISGSIGIALYPDDAQDADGLIKAADAAMYVAKDQGKATYQFFTGALREKEVETQALGRALERALDHDEFTLLYLPKVSLADGRVTGMEALLRWKSDSLGAVTPDRFIPLLEERGLITSVGDWVLRTAGAQWKAWKERFGLDLRIAINLSARQLRGRGFAKQFGETLESVGLPPGCVELEITETSVISQRSRTTDVLQDLHDLGVNLTMDDFGTGYASLRYLQSLPVSSVKVDRTFVQHLLEDDEDRAIILSIVSMAHAFGKAVVAEGVETQEQMDALKDLGCDEAQGFLIAPPLSADEVNAFLAERMGDFVAAD